MNPGPQSGIFFSFGKLFNQKLISMKKLFSSILLVISVFIFGQENKPLYFMGAGFGVFSGDTRESSAVGLNLNFALANVYMDFSSNFSTGDGEELDYSSSQTYESDKLQVNLINFGYAIRLNKVSIIPVMGYGWTRKIYQDPVAFDTYFYGDSEGKFNIGAIGVFEAFKGGGFYAGVGSFEVFKAGVYFSLL